MTQEMTVRRKRRQKKIKIANPVKIAKSKSRTNSYAESAKQNLRNAVIYENKPRPAARGRSQNTGREGCKNFTNKCYNQYNISTSKSTTTMHETCINRGTEHQPNTWHNNLRIEEV